MPAADLPVWVMGMLRIIQDQPWSLEARSLLRPDELAHASRFLGPSLRFLPQQNVPGVFRTEGAGSRGFKETMVPGTSDCALITRGNHAVLDQLKKGDEKYMSYISKRHCYHTDAMSAICHYEDGLRKIIGAVAIPEEDNESPIRTFYDATSNPRYAISHH